MKSPNGTSGINIDNWTLAFRVGTAILQKYACSQQEKCCYSEFCEDLVRGCGVRFEPHEQALSKLLGEISINEYQAGRGMLTVILVHKHGDGMPGKGFFECAEYLGLDVTDKEVLWIDQSKKVYGYWKGRTPDQL